MSSIVTSDARSRGSGASLLRIIDVELSDMRTPSTRRVPAWKPVAKEHEDPATGVTVHPRIRIYRGDVIAFGPGKADLLEAIRRTGSITKAAVRLGMSYMRAWHLVQTMNGEFRAPVVSTFQGGGRHGGAVVTETGEAVLDLYREMVAASVRAMAPAWRRLRPRLRR